MESQLEALLGQKVYLSGFNLKVGKSIELTGVLNKKQNTYIVEDCYSYDDNDEECEVTLVVKFKVNRVKQIDGNTVFIE